MTTFLCRHLTKIKQTIFDSFLVSVSEEWSAGPHLRRLGIFLREKKELYVKKVFLKSLKSFWVSLLKSQIQTCVLRPVFWIRILFKKIKRISI
jgi:hypothetical protein